MPCKVRIRPTEPMVQTMQYLRLGEGTTEEASRWTYNRFDRMTLKLITGINLVLIVFILPQHVYSSEQSKFRQLKPGCRYDGRRYEEDTMVNTTEPCLQCRCIEGALRCRLRVCPRLPNSPPSGCHIRQPEENVCCAELICGGPLERQLSRDSKQTTCLDIDN
ncbi:hypothetical protein HZH66_000166 [Vespula vulgaris]|uniref:VWFC domain-containing protein n=1 Tax=Vespula vulgaris TaxID=7454 RepID=A0A834NID2_VESVU|nr:hypothetical protein HZH66_000166 [Vespula vulgaris]